MITAINGEMVASLEQFIALIGKHQIGETVEVTFVRGKDTRTVRISLEKAPLEIPAPDKTPLATPATTPAPTKSATPLAIPAATSAPTKTATPTAATSKALPASHAGRTTCTVCHEAGIAGAPKLPPSHAGRTDATCITCHKRA